MRVYQIIKCTGCYEDYYEYVEGTYLHKEKAEHELDRLKASVPYCEDCPYTIEYQTRPIITDCPHHKPEICDYYEEDGDIYACRNCIDPYDSPSYKMNEYDVDESEE